MTTQEHLCELGCGRPAPDTTICSKCADDPRRAVNEFTADELQRLYAIAYGIENSAETTARKTRDKSSYEDALNLHAFVLAEAITHEYPQHLETLATKPDATDLYYKITGDCEKAHSLINGHEIDWAESEIKQVHQDLYTPKPAKEIIDWLWDKLRIKVTPVQIRLWAHRGKIEPAEGTGKEHKQYRPKDVLELAG